MKLIEVICRNIKGCNTAVITDINYQQHIAPSFLLSCDFVLFEAQNVATATRKNGDKIIVKWNVRRYCQPKIRRSVKIHKKKIFIMNNSKVIAKIDNNVKSIVDYLRSNGFYWANKNQGKTNLLKMLGNTVN